MFTGKPARSRTVDIRLSFVQLLDVTEVHRTDISVIGDPHRVGLVPIADDLNFDRRPRRFEKEASEQTVSAI
jgi:hypothetical protein